MLIRCTSPLLGIIFFFLFTKFSFNLDILLLTPISVVDLRHSVDSIGLAKDLELFKAKILFQVNFVGDS